MRATQVLAFRRAAILRWGVARWTSVVEAVPEVVRRELFERELVAVAWVPEEHIMAVSEAVFVGPAAADLAEYRGFVGQMMDVGFGRLRRFMFQFAPPHALLSKAPELWRHDHTHGDLTVAIIGKTARVNLRNHIHVTTELARLTCAETFRYALGLTRARDVEESHALDGGLLQVDLRWR